MKRLITVILCMTILLISTFSFAEPSLWANEEVERADEWGLIPERLKDDYQRDITREEFSELVVNLYESLVGKTIEEVYESPFIDTDNQSVLKAYRLGIINGIGDSRFAPGSLVNREQIATMLYRMLESLDPDIVNGYHEFTFTDRLDTSEWAIAPIGFMNGSSIIKGYADNEFKPKNNTSIEQSIAMVVRIYDFLGATISGEESDEHYLDDGSRYIGEMTNGYPHGVGVLYMPLGDRYEGNFAEGHFDGYGVYYWNNGDTYEGYYKDSLRHGYGEYTWVDGESYEGYFSNGLRNGNGIYYFSDGSYMEGQWIDDEYVEEVIPPAVYVRAISDDEIEIGWTEVPGVDYYYIYYSDDMDGPWYHFEDDQGNIAPLRWVSEYSSTLYGIGDNTRIYFKMTSVVDGEESYFSNIDSDTTFRATVYDAPEDTVETFSRTYTGLSLYSDENPRVYLGELTSNEFDSDSIFNEFGTYGSRFSSNSIWNQFGTYGSQFSSYSAFSDFASSPPLIIDTDGNVLGRLTVNKFKPGAISPYDIKVFLRELGL